MKIAIIGIGDIAKKAYLPVLSFREEVELILCTRNKKVLDEMKSLYRIDKAYSSVDDLINSEEKIDGAIVSTTTTAHYETAVKLIKNKINVYIDKPISMNLNETEEIVSLARENNIIAMVGFNRRFCPMVKSLKEKGKADIVIMQKNRGDEPDITRRYIVEDFIHVVDTLRFLADGEIKGIDISYKKNGDMLENVVLTLKTEYTTAIGIMNRRAGVTEENIEYMTNEGKYIVENLQDRIFEINDSGKKASTFGWWETTLYKRGFNDMLSEFINAIKENRQPNPSLEDSLESHKICEKVVEEILNNK
ncbi:Gfo/Idh/MocA family protein [Clostridium isatidis]|uniref:Oxidoreductase n=1 Tax=Clostridium isatidis TaxID=182773 RepID=A0A343JA52_9CLOT|nr:Gfo/Idh/MocA family oxidoreductase [Clostridium isatidis]ASW42410.1 oxidoreductase [Clostridium isatidis]